MIRVVLADDHPIVLLGIKNALATAPDISVVGSADSPDSLFACLAQTPCDVVVTDFSMPGGTQPDGLAMLQQLRAQYPHIHVVVLTKIATPTMISPALQAGALALVEKSAAIKEISTAIQRAASGLSYFTESIRNEFAALGVAQSQLTARAALSPREMEVVRLFASGRTNNEIAQILGLSAKTTSRQKQDAMRKLAARNDAELIAYAKDLGLL
ncbi:response regulator transcription factor [Bordetella sp. N]|uniref:response regulator transcription factor n=1 Tax=Bordetella sp. N TaxID=1746199 RepID=UPI00070DE246|nr:response regulator transcription factor [Bordetella sp. N]ALM86409.1 hypothetical protein ASB57_28860 [Bordetella sp. N]